MKKLHVFLISILGALLGIYILASLVLQSEAKKSTTLFIKGVESAFPAQLSVQYQSVSIWPFGVFTRTMKVNEVRINSNLLPNAQIVIPQLKVNMAAKGFFSGTAALHVSADKTLIRFTHPNVATTIPAPVIQIGQFNLHIIPNGQAIPTIQTSISGIRVVNITEVIQAVLHAAAQANKKAVPDQKASGSQKSSSISSDMFKPLMSLNKQLDLNHLALDLSLNYQGLDKPIFFEYVLYKSPALLASGQYSFAPTVDHLGPHPTLLDILIHSPIIASQKHLSLNAHFSPSDLQLLGIAAPLKMLGYSTLDFSILTQSEYYATGGQAHAAIRIQWRHAGSLMFQYHLSNVPTTTLAHLFALQDLALLEQQNLTTLNQSTENKLWTMIKPIVLRHQKLVYVDQGLIPRLYHLFSTLTGTPANKVPESIATPLLAIAKHFNTLGAPHIAGMLTTVAKFALHPKQIEFDLRPNPPMSFNDMRVAFSTLGQTFGSSADENKQDLYDEKTAIQGLDALLSKLHFTVK